MSETSPSAFTHTLTWVAVAPSPSVCSFTGLSLIPVDVFDFCDFHTCAGFRACPSVQLVLFSVDISCWRCCVLFIILHSPSRIWLRRLWFCLAPSQGNELVVPSALRSQVSGVLLNFAGGNNSSRAGRLFPPRWSPADMKTRMRIVFICWFVIWMTDSALGWLFLLPVHNQVMREEKRKPKTSEIKGKTCTSMLQKQKTGV